MDMDKKRFEKMFPRLAQEIGEGESRISITSIRSDSEAGEKAASNQFEGYDPDIIDFLRRCDNDQQAREIIRYLEQKKEIAHEYAGRLRKQLREKGVRSFGTKKEEDYYIKRAGI